MKGSVGLKGGGGVPMKRLAVFLGVVVAAIGAAQPSMRPAIVSREREPRRFSEPHLAVHPGRPNHLLAAVWTASTSESEDQERRCSSLVSTDGGSTWARHD